MTEVTDPFVSVIIPVFNDRQRLKACLQALEQQTYPKHLYEVIVVDNGSDESPQSVVAPFGQATLSHESRPSQFAARNKGLAIARGEVIAFSDSDCIPHANWIERGVMHLKRAPNCGLVAGKVEIFFRNPNRPTAVELYDGATNLTQETYVEEGRFGATANLFTRRKVFDEVGLFEDQTKSGGDVEWSHRALSGGYELVYAADVRVAHPARRTFRELCRMVVRRIGGVHDMRRVRECSFLGIGRGSVRGLIPPIRHSARTWFDPALESEADKLKVIAVMFFVRYVEEWERVRLKLGGESRR